MPYRGKVTTGGEVLPELYEISALYHMRGRPDYITSEPGDIYKSVQWWLVIETAASQLDGIVDNDATTPTDVRLALISLATNAVAWAREIREQCQ